MQTQKKPFHETLLPILLFLLLIFNNETLANNLCTFVSQPVQYVSGVLIILFFFWVIPTTGMFYRFNLRVFFGAVALLASIVCAIVQDSGFTNGYTLALLAILSGMSIVLSMKFEEFERLFVKYMVILSVISLVCTYLLKPIAGNFGPLFPIVRNSANIRFYNMHLCYVVEKTNYIRNFGLFREPGIYAIFLLLAIILLLHQQASSKNKWFFIYLVILTVTLLSTFSTTGYLSLIFVGVWGLTSNRRLRIWQILLLLVLFAGLMAFSESKIANPFTKLDTEHSSFQTRIESFRAGVTVIFSNILGHGILSGNQAMSEYYNFNSYHVINTITTMGVFWGLGFMLAWLIGLWKFCVYRIKGMLLIIPFLLMLSGGLLIYNPLIYIIMFYGLSGAGTQKNIL